MKVGDYVRTNYGTIFKIENMVEIDVDGTWFKSKVKENSIIKDLPRFMYDEEDEIINKQSPNIIDLIEVGDYVNGNKIVHIQEEEFPNYPKRLLFAGVDENNIDDVWEVYNNEDIKSIVTKEQFSQMEYRIGD